jgi:hypothetical protein
VIYLQRYGSHAKAVLPQLRETRAQLADAAGKKGPSEFMDKLDQCIAAIESSNETPTIVDLADFKTSSTAN